MTFDELVQSEANTRVQARIATFRKAVCRELLTLLEHSLGWEVRESLSNNRVRDPLAIEALESVISGRRQFWPAVLWSAEELKVAGELADKLKKMPVPDKTASPDDEPRPAQPPAPKDEDALKKAAEATANRMRT